MLTAPLPRISLVKPRRYRSLAHHTGTSFFPLRMSLERLLPRGAAGRTRIISLLRVMVVLLAVFAVVLGR